MPGWDTPESAGQRSTSRSSKPSGPPGGGATSQGSGRDHSPSPSRDPGGHHRDTPVAIVQNPKTGEVKVVNVPSNEDLLTRDILQGPNLPETGVKGPPSIISGP